MQCAALRSVHPPLLLILPQASESRRLGMWWAYSANMARSCSFAQRTFSHTCAFQQAVAAGVNGTALRACMGRTDVGDTNVRLEIEYMETAREARKPSPTGQSQGPVLHRGRMVCGRGY